VVSLYFFLFTDCFNVEANRSVGLRFLDGDPVLVNSLDGYFLEVAISIRAEHHDLVQFDGTSRHNTAKYQSDTLGLVAGVDDKLIGDDLVRSTHFVSSLFDSSILAT